MKQRPLKSLTTPEFLRWRDHLEVYLKRRRKLLAEKLTKAYPKQEVIQ